MSNRKKKALRTDNSCVMLNYREEDGEIYRGFGTIVRMFLAWISPDAAQPEVVCECEWYRHDHDGDGYDELNGLPKITRWPNFNRAKFALLKNMYVEGCVFWPAHEWDEEHRRLVVIPETFNVLRNRCDRSTFNDLNNDL